MRILFMLFNDWLIRSVGTLLVWVGVLGIVFNYNFDRMAGYTEIDFGGWQRVAFVVFTFFIYWGLVVKKFWKMED